MMTLDRTHSPFIGRQSAKICDAYLEVNLGQTRVSELKCKVRVPQKSRLQTRRVSHFITLESRISVPSECCVFTLNQVHICNAQRAASLYQVRDASSLQMKLTSTKKHNPCIYKNCVSFLKIKVSLCFFKQSYSIIAKAYDNSPSSTVHQQSDQSSDKV